MNDTSVKIIEWEEMTRIANAINSGAMGIDLVHCIEEDKFYIYRNGYWEDIYEVEILGMIAKHPEFRYVVKHSISKRKQIIENLKILTLKRLEEFNCKGYLNFDAGEFDPITLTMLDHDKDNYSTMRISYPFDGSTTCPLWEKTLEEIFEGNKEKTNLLQEFFGYCITPDITQKKALLLLGDTDCLGGETLIYDPIKNKHTAVSEIKEDFNVEAWDGEKIVIAKALKPFTKEVDDLYTVTLSNNKSFVCSKSHKILTSSGYVPLGELHEGAEVFLPCSNSDNDLLDHASSACHYQSIAPSLISDYHFLSRSYDAQLLLAKDNDQSSFPLQDDVREYDLGNAFLQKDAQQNKQEHNHFYQSHDHHANSGYLNQADLECFYKLICAFYKVCELVLYPLLSVLQSMIEVFRPQPICKSFPSDNNSCSSLPYKPLSLVITSIVYKRRDVKWDFTVPEYHNYICSGAVHHNSGKSTVLNVLRAMLGSKNCSSVPLKYLSHPQYTPMMINKFANIDADVSKDAQSYEAEFKIITSGEPISCNQKFVETFEFVPRCKIILAANVFPKIADHSSAFYSRLILIPCNRRFQESEKNRNLFNQLKNEMSGILNWSIEGLRRLNKRGMFPQDDFMKEAVKELEDMNNPTNIFFEDHIEVEIGDHIHIEKGILYQHYKEWCMKNGHGFLTNARFSESVYNKFSKATPKTTHLPSTGKRIWRNLKYVENMSDESRKGEKINWED